MEALDVVVVKAIQVGRSNDRRPCVVVSFRPPSHTVVVPCSSSKDLYNPVLHLMFSNWHKDFEATGFRRSTYAIDDFVEVPDADVVKTPIGRLQGEFARKFLEWAGLT